MKYNHLVVIAPRKWLPKNTEQACVQTWAAVTQLLIPNLGNLYSRFSPAVHPQDYALCAVTLEMEATT